MRRRCRPVGRAQLAWAAAAVIVVASASYLAITRLHPFRRVATASSVVQATSSGDLSIDRIAVQGATTKVTMPDGFATTIKTVLRTPNVMRFGQWIWRDPPSATGALWIRVDLARQLISVFRGSDEIGTAIITYGAEDKPTPRGLYFIRTKLREHHSSLYDAEMPYTLGLTDDGIAIHASIVRPGTATHGCVGVPDGFARKLFAAAEKGTRVLIDG